MNKVLGIIIAIVFALTVYPLVFQLAWNGLLTKSIVCLGTIDFWQSFKLWLALVLIKNTLIGFSKKH